MKQRILVIVLTGLVMLPCGAIRAAGPTEDVQLRLDVDANGTGYLSVEANALPPGVDDVARGLVSDLVPGGVLAVLGIQQLLDSGATGVQTTTLRRAGRERMAIRRPFATTAELAGIWPGTAELEQHRDPLGRTTYRFSGTLKQPARAVLGQGGVAVHVALPGRIVRTNGAVAGSEATWSQPANWPETFEVESQTGLTNSELAITLALLLSGAGIASVGYRQLCRDA